MSFFGRRGGNQPPDIQQLPDSPRWSAERPQRKTLPERVQFLAPLRVTSSRDSRLAMSSHFNGTYLGLTLRSYGGDWTSVPQFDGTTIQEIVHGSQSMNTLRADALLRQRATAAGTQSGFDSDADFVRELVSCFQAGHSLLASTPDSDDPDRPGVGRTWSNWLLKRARDPAPGNHPPQRMRNILAKEVRARHAGGMIRLLKEAVDIVREQQGSSGED